MALEDALDEVSKNLVGTPYSVVHSIMDVSELMAVTKTNLIPTQDLSGMLVQSEDEARFALDCLQEFEASYFSDGEGNYTRLGIVPVKEESFLKRHPTLVKIIVAGLAICVPLAAILLAFGSQDKDNSKKSDDKDTNSLDGNYVGPAEFSINNGDSIAIKNVEEISDGIILSFEARDLQDKSKEPKRANYIAFISNNAIGTYVQSENWGTQEDRADLVYDNFEFGNPAYRNLFRHPMQESGEGDTINGLTGKLYKDGEGNYVIKDVSRLALYDGQVLEVDKSAKQSLNAIVISEENIFAGAKHVVVRPLNKPTQTLDLYFFGNRAYNVNGELVTTDQLQFSRGDVITASGYTVTTWGNEYGGPEMNDGTLAVLDYYKKLKI